MRHQLATCGALVFLLLLAGTAWGQSRVRVVTISAVGNQVQEKLPPPPGTSASVTAWTKAARNAPVVEGEKLRTSVNSFVEVELECGSALRLAPESEMAFPRLELSKQGMLVTAVRLDRGEGFFTMQDADAPDFQAELPGGVIRMPRGGAKLRLDVPEAGPESVEVLGGQIQVQAGGQKVKLKARRRFAFLPGGGIDLLPLLRPDAWQKWSQRRDDVFHREVMKRETIAPPADLSGTVPTPTGPVPAGTIGADPEGIIGPIVGAMNDEAHAGSRVQRVPNCAER